MYKSPSCRLVHFPYAPAEGANARPRLNLVSHTVTQSRRDQQLRTGLGRTRPPAFPSNQNQAHRFCCHTNELFMRTILSVCAFRIYLKLTSVCPAFVTRHLHQFLIFRCLFVLKQRTFLCMMCFCEFIRLSRCQYHGNNLVAVHGAVQTLHL